MSRRTPVAELIRRAHRERWAVGQFNMSSLDTLHGIVDAASAAQTPCMVGLSLTSLRYVGPEYLAGLIPAARSQASVPLYFHLDHGADLDDVRQVVAMGFDSVMIDTSMLAYAENVARVREVVAFARDHGVGVEAQLGETWEAGSGAGRETVTDPAMVAEFAHATGIDYLACSFGNKPAGGVGIGTPDRTLFERIAQASPVPLVVHGGTSLTDDMIRFGDRMRGRQDQHRYLDPACRHADSGALLCGARSHGGPPRVVQAGPERRCRRRCREAEAVHRVVHCLMIAEVRHTAERFPDMSYRTAPGFACRYAEYLAPERG